MPDAGREGEDVGAVDVAPTPETSWVKWAWYHFMLYADEFPTREAAVKAAAGADESLVCIEGPDGTLVSPGEMYDEWLATDDDAEADLPFHVYLRAPLADDEGCIASFQSREERDSAAIDYRRRFGDRVVLRERFDVE